VLVLVMKWEKEVAVATAKFEEELYATARRRWTLRVSGAKI